MGNRVHLSVPSAGRFDARGLDHRNPITLLSFWTLLQHITNHKDQRNILIYIYVCVRIIIYYKNIFDIYCCFSQKKTGDLIQQGPHISGTASPKAVPLLDHNSSCWDWNADLPVASGGPHPKYSQIGLGMPGGCSFQDRKSIPSGKLTQPLKIAIYSGFSHEQW